MQLTRGQQRQSLFRGEDEYILLYFLLAQVAILATTVAVYVYGG